MGIESADHHMRVFAEAAQAERVRKRSREIFLKTGKYPMPASGFAGEIVVLIGFGILCYLYARYGFC